MIGRPPITRSRIALDGPTRQAIETGRTRLLVTGAIFAIAFAVVGFRLVEVTVLEYGNGARTAQSHRGAMLKTGRADIVDRNGTLLATSLATASLHADTRAIKDPQKVTAHLRQILPDLDAAATLARLRSGRRFVWLRRHLTPRQKYAVNRLGIPGLDFRREERRVFPTGKLAAHVLGHTDIDNNGLAGIERRFDADLKNRAAPLQLSIDSRAQHLMESSLRRAMRRFRAIGAAGVVQDVRNGEIIAMVSLPDFDPNQPTAIEPDTRFNRASLGVYEMGSTFKIFTIAMALNTGRISLRNSYDATRPIRISRFVIRDYHAKRRRLSIPEIFIYSSNIGAAKMAMDVGPGVQRDFLRRLGLLNASPVELSEVGAPLKPKRWRDVNAMTISFGHGLAVSPLQLVSAVSAMVNGGVLYPATLLRRSATRPTAGKRVISARTSERIRRLLRLVVTKGTGSKAAAPGYLVGGKTGTAEKVMGRRYKRKALMSSFIGAFPMHAPRYVVFAMLDEPIGTKETHGYATGGWVAAPVVGQVIERLGPLLGVPPVDEDDPAVQRKLAVEIRTFKPGKRLASF